MAANKPRKTLADYLAIAITPGLIMALVGSLVFFLVAVLYKGPYSARLEWILFFFVFGAVLIARISMTSGIADRARLYGLVLGLLVWIALLLYVDWGTSPLAPFGWAIDLGLIGITWWCAHRLTWDCTLIDDSVDASGAGLLQEAGLEGKAGPDAAEEPAAEAEEELPGLMGWFARYRRYRRQQERKPHAPGVWVVYFSLAALPLYGLGQALIDVDDLPRRRYAFWLMTIYVASGLGLLLATSFLGLRRYLRQRGLKMPLAMTGTWLTVGALLIGAFLLVGALLPRPHAEDSPIRDWLGKGVDGPERKASEYAEGKNPGKDEGRAARDKSGKDTKDKGGSNKNAKDKGDQKDKDGSGKDKDSSGKDKGSSQKDKDKSGKDQKASGKDKNASSRGKGSSSDQKQADKKEDQSGKSDGSEKSGEDKQAGSPKLPHSKIPEWGKRLGTILKWIVAGVVAVLVLFLLLRNGLKFLANFTHWARRLLDTLAAIWNALWGWWGGRAEADAEETEAAPAVEPKPFASFRDPFESGTADRMSPEQLVRYSFEALQAWAWERGLARQTGETPLEFADRLGEEVPALEAEARQLANYYAQIAYARGSLTRACRDPLRRFWLLLVEAVEKPMSAGVG